MKKHIIIATFALASALIFSVSCAKQEVSVLEKRKQSRDFLLHGSYRPGLHKDCSGRKLYNIKIQGM